MKRLFAILLSLLIVGAPTAAGMLITYRQAQARVAEEAALLADVEAEGKSLRQQLQTAMTISNKKAKEEVERILEEQRQAEEEKKAAEAAAAAGASSGGSAQSGTVYPGSAATVDVSYWQGVNSDVIGYIYNPGSAISYPILWGNIDYYMHHDIYGQESVSGCIALANENSPGFSDGNSIIQGHNMKAGTMFAALTYYKNASYYTTHPCMYLYTPTQTYRVDLFAGFACPHDYEVYTTALTSDQISRFKAQSTFYSSVEPTGRILTLSTCSYEHDNWRYVVLGEMVPIS